MTDQIVEVYPTAAEPRLAREMKLAEVVVYYSYQFIRLSLGHDRQRRRGAINAIFRRSTSRLQKQGSKGVLIAGQDASDLRLGPRTRAGGATAGLCTRRSVFLFAVVFDGGNGPRNIMVVDTPRKYRKSWGCYRAGKGQGRANRRSPVLIAVIDEPITVQPNAAAGCCDFALE